MPGEHLDRVAKTSDSPAIVTLLFSDIEGSTGLLRRLGDAYSDLLIEHRDVLRTAFESNGGSIIGTEGDGFLVAFPRAKDGLAAAIDAQRSLEAHSWPPGVEVRVRMGLHTGDVLRTTDGYIGMTVHQAARVCSAAHGGQVLVSEATRHVVGDALPPLASLHELGSHHLRDFTDPQMVFELRHPDLCFELPTLRSPAMPSPNIPGANENLLLERRCEFERLTVAIACATTCEGSVVALEGEAGIGKSALLAYAAQSAGSAGFRVLSARGGELEQDFGYGVVRQLFDAPLAAMAGEERERVLSGAAALAASTLSVHDRSGGGVGDPGAALHGLYWLTANLAAEAPVLITVDDAHWADSASIAFLSYLARRVEGLALLVLYTTRISEGLSEHLPATAEPGLGVTVLRPVVLSELATVKLIGRLLGRESSKEFARACRVATAGNPFLLQELVRALEVDGIVPDDTSTARVAQIAPRSITRATLARLRQLGPHPGELAFAVAVLGKSAELRHAASLARLDLDAAGEAADALTSAAILRDGRPLEFIHPIVRTTIYNELAPGRRAATHKRAALLLAEDDRGDVGLAPHLLATEPSADPWVVERLRGAAQDSLASGAIDAACTYLIRALAEPPSSSHRPVVLLELGTAELRTASSVGAIDHLRDALENAHDTQIRTDAAVHLAYALAWSDRIREAIQLVDRVIEQIGEHDEEAAMKLDGLVICWCQLGDSTWTLAGERLSRYAGRLYGRSTGERMLLAAAAFEAARRDQPAARAAELAELALADSRLLEEDPHHAPNFYLAAWTLFEADGLEQADHYFSVAIDHARARGSQPSFAVATSCRCQVRFKQGRIAEAEAEARSVLEVAPLRRKALIACVLDAMVERTDFDAREAFLQDENVPEDLSDAMMGIRLLYSRGHSRLAAGAAEAALRDFEQIRAREERWGLDTAALPTRASAALAHAQLGEPERACELAQEQLERARVWGTPSALAFALRTAGIVEGGDRGIELLRQAAAAVEHSPARYERLLSLTEYGAALRRAGHRRDAREPLREALELADRCGALRTAARAREELLATGARPRRAALSGADSLTPSERRVTRLAADGLSNREIAQALFVTVRTVEGHLTQAYTKLEITRREQLATALA